MREAIRDKERLLHMLQAIDNILDNKDKYSYEEVIANPIIYYGFVKHVEIIGEACYKLTKEFRATNNELDWDVIEGMRHVLVHGYYKIRPEQLWDTVVNDIPEMRPEIMRLYEKEINQSQ